MSFVVDDVVDVVDIVDVVDVDGDTDDDEPSWWSELHTDHGESNYVFWPEFII